MKLLLIATMLLTSCGYADDYLTKRVGLHQRFTQIDDEIKPYVDEFNKDCHVPPMIMIPAGFAKLQDGHAGECQEWQIAGMDYEEIAIDPDKWEHMTVGQRRWLLKHELGHCLLNRDHDNTMRDKRVPKSIMIDTVPSNAAELLYLWNDYYINELCNGR